MRKLIIPALVALTVPACGGGNRVYSSPAPEGALDCALGKATEMGFYPLDGGTGDGFVKMARSVDYKVADAGKEAAARIMSFGLAGNNRTEMDHLTLTGAGGRLQVQILGVKEDGTGSPSKQGDADAQAILDSCSGR